MRRAARLRTRVLTHFDTRTTQSAAARKTFAPGGRLGFAILSTRAPTRRRRSLDAQEADAAHRPPDKLLAVPGKNLCEYQWRAPAALPMYLLPPIDFFPFQNATKNPGRVVAARWRRAGSRDVFSILKHLRTHRGHRIVAGPRLCLRAKRSSERRMRFGLTWLRVRSRGHVNYDGTAVATERAKICTEEARRLKAFLRVNGFGCVRVLFRFRGATVPRDYRPKFIND